MNLLFRILYLVLRLAVFGLRLLPLAVGYRICDGAARIAFRLDGKRRRRGLANVARALPERSDAEHRTIIRGSYRNLFRLGYEITLTGRCLRAENLASQVVFEGVEHLEALPVDGRGSVRVSGHFGNWEVLGVAMACSGTSLTAVAKGVDADVFERFLRRLREVHGQKIISFQGAVKEGRKLILDGISLGFVADQHAPVNRIWIPFFGVPSAFVKAPAGLARRFGVPLVICFCRRTGPGFRFVVTFFPLVFPDPERPVREDIARMTLEFVQRLESVIRAQPEDYLWLSRLWRTPKDGEEFMGGDGTYVRHAAFGSGRDQTDPPEESLESGPSRPAGQGDGA